METQNALTVAESPAGIMERVIIAGDLAKLTAEERVTYYMRVCDSIGLNPLTKPFDYITLNGKLTLYPNKDCAAQLRRIQSVSITNLQKELIGDIYTVTIFGRANGREDVATGAVNVRALSGEALANAYMKAETKAKRRLSLSLAGLGFVDETEVEDIPDTTDDGKKAPASLAERVAQRAAEVRGEAPKAEEPTAEPVSEPIEGEVVEGGCGWRLDPGKGGDLIPCALEEMHAGNHSWHEQALKQGGKVVRPE